MKIELTIKVDYLPTWGLREGVRELLQNAKDAETEFSAPMTVRTRGEVLVIENEGCTMPYEALLLGHTSKSERGDLIGKFGEGFKLGVLALLRAGHTVKIRNGSEVWIPEILHSEKFNARVLAFDIQKNRKDENRVAIEISGISLQTFKEDIAPCFLWLSKDMVKESDKVTTEYGTLLLSPIHKGKVFVKGILVETKSDLTVGYDIHDADVDRDRRMVSSYDFSWKTRLIWRQAMGQRPDLFGAFHQIIEMNAPEVQGLDAYDATRLPLPFVQHVVDAFVAKHGGKAVPVSNLGESQELEHFGRTGVVVNPALRAVLETKLGNLGATREALKNEVTRTYGWHELTKEQRANVLRAVKLVNEISPVSLDEINVVDFRSTDLEGTFSAAGIQLSASTVANASACLTVVVHEVAHRSGSDGEKGHVAQIEHIWSSIVQNLTKFTFA